MNKWKVAFVAIVLVNLLFISFIVTFLMLPGKNEVQKELKQSLEGNHQQITVPFLVSTQKKSLSNLINHYLEKEADQKNLQYYVALENSVNVYGSIEAFKKDIDMTLILEPKVKTDGNMQLLVQELSIGRLKLPVSYVLKYMNTNYDFPKYVKVDPKSNEINIHLDELTLKNGLSVRAERFDLEKDDITFTLYVPLP